MSQDFPSRDGVQGYDGAAFLDASSAKRWAGRITFTGHAVIFTCEAQRVEFSFHGLEMKLGGASDRIIFFSHGRHPGVSIFTSDQRILKDPNLLAHEGVAEQIRAIGGQKRRSWAFVGSVFGIMALLILGLWMSRGFMIQGLVNRIPPSLEVQVGNSVFNQIKTTTTIIEDETLNAMLAELAEPIVAVVPEREDYDFRFHLADDPSVNAFAMPGGHIVVHTGLILRADTPEEIMGVIGHEIAHVTARHSTRKIVGTLGLITLFQLLVGDISGISSVIVVGGAELATLSYSRDHEREADELGWEYLVDAGIHPKGLIDFLSQLRALEEENPIASATGDSLSFMSTHPATSERIDRLRGKLSETNTTALIPVEFDLDAFKEAIRKEQGKL